MKINNLRTIDNDDYLTISAKIESEKIGNKELWFSIPKQYKNYLCTSQMDAFLVGLLYPAMQYNEDIYIDGCVSKKLLFNINTYVIPLLMSYSNSAKKIKVNAKSVSSEKFIGKGIGTGFSGGVDSFSTIYDLYQKEKDPEIKINSLLFLNVGSHGADQKLSQSKFQKRYHHLQDFPTEIGVEFIPVDSNLHQFHPWGHQETHSLTSIAGVLVLQNYFSKYYYSSSGLDYNDIIKSAYSYKGIDIGIFCDPILLPLLSTETIDFIIDGVQYTRTDKILNISNYGPTFKFLNVCVSGDDTHENCSACSKCLRTLLALDFSGNLDKYSNLFDIQKYKKLKSRYIYQQVATQHTNTFSKANIDLAKYNNIKLPNYFISKLYFILTYQLKIKMKGFVKNLSPTIYEKIKNHKGIK